jgi:hypothetical protein
MTQFPAPLEVHARWNTLLSDQRWHYRRVDRDAPKPCSSCVFFPAISGIAMHRTGGAKSVPLQIIDKRPATFTCSFFSNCVTPGAPLPSPRRSTVPYVSPGRKRQVKTFPAKAPAFHTHYRAGLCKSADVCPASFMRVKCCGQTRCGPLQCFSGHTGTVRSMDLVLIAELQRIEYCQ